MRSVWIQVVGCLLWCVSANAAGVLDTEIDLTYEKFVLDNGLTLIVHEDHKAPIVAINVWYHVGSKNEVEGKTGFAHLFEHLMFNGSENFNDDYFIPLERAGATDMNGTTNSDRTNYFQNVPVAALDVALWMESDRMGHLLGAVDQAKLDEQRGVVQNEKRQGENRPYGLAFNAITENTYPKGHPYSWTVIGSLDDLDAASLEDVQKWFKTYYGAANAVLSIAGDVDPQDVKARVEKYFGDIPSGPPVTKQQAWIAKRTGEHRQRMEDRVPQSRIYKVWNVPEWGTRESVDLDLLSSVLASGKTSRLYKRLVYDDKIATSVEAYMYSRELSGQFIVEVTAREGIELSVVERAIDEELARLVKEGPSTKELERVKTQHFAGFIRGVERIGGFGGVSDVLALNEIYGGEPGMYAETLDEVRNATARDLQKTGATWLSDGVYVLEIVPFPEYMTKAVGADRSAVPEINESKKAAFPDIQRATLSNGVKLVFAERHAVPLVMMDLMLDVGYAADYWAVPGLANLTVDMLDEGTVTLGALEISEKLALLGAELGTSSTMDYSTISLSSLTANLSASLDLFADVLLNPAFDENEFTRLQQQQLASIEQEKASPNSLGMRLLPQVMFGEDHPYGSSFTGSGTTESVSRITPLDLKNFHGTWFKPGNATLVVVGDTTLKELVPMLETALAKWKAGQSPKKIIPNVEGLQASQVYMVDRPGAPQSYIYAAQIAPAYDPDDESAIDAANTVFGGSFTSRINMNLREDKHWSYGARSQINPLKNQRAFIVSAGVQTDKSKESLVEVQSELKGILAENPVSAEELDKIKLNKVQRLAGRWETLSSVKSELRQMVAFDLPGNYFDTYSEDLESLTLPQVQNAASAIIKPDQLIWLVVGDLEKIQSGIEELGLGASQVVDGDGNPVH